MRTESRHCGSCGDERPFETPPCTDGHGVDCPERVCTHCGSALLVDPPRTADTVTVTHRTSYVARTVGSRMSADRLVGRRF